MHTEPAEPTEQVACTPHQHLLNALHLLYTRNTPTVNTEPTAPTVTTAPTAPTAPTAAPVSGAVGRFLATLVGVYRATLAPFLLAPPPHCCRRQCAMPAGYGWSLIVGAASQSQRGRGVVALVVMG